MRKIDLICVLSMILLATLGKLYNMASAEELTTENLVPAMSEFTTSGGTSFGTGSGCGSGAFCTSGTGQGGGTYTSSFDVPLTEDELQQGFTLNSAITINSHPSNSALSTCESITQSSDCRDIFRLSLTLSDGNTEVESFSHQEELDFAGLRNFTFSDVVEANDYGVLTGIYELFGIDAGFSSGFFGPQFSNPSLTIDYQTALVEEEVLATITNQIETETQEIIAETVAPETVPVTLAALVESFPALPTQLATETQGSSLDALPSVNVSDISTTTEPVSSAPAELAPPPPPEAPVAPAIAPIAPSSEAQQEQATSAEAEIEAAVEAPAETVDEASSEAPAETSAEPQAAESSEGSSESPGERSAEGPAESSAEGPAEAPAAASEDTTDETSAENTAESAEEPESKAANKSTKSASRRKVASTASSSAPVVSVPVTPAMAAQSVVDAIAPSQKYGSAAQTLTLVAMGIIAQNRALFKGAGIPDAAVGFFTSVAVPDGPSMVDRMQNYRIFGQANGIHQRLIESQWSK